MIQPVVSPEQIIRVDRSRDAIARAITTIRETHEEIDPRQINRMDESTHCDRRSGRRVQMQIPVVFTSVEEAGNSDDFVEVCGPDQIAVTRDLSLQGLGIVHDMRLMTDLALIQFDIPGESQITMLFEARWTTRKTRYSFVSGGRLIGVVNGEPE
ncbi:MAG: hypothetical protein KDA93_26265 [Planctomycetaceae bacterium]|nr:hypothetical protein [Planctomycetaceae bacterium]